MKERGGGRRGEGEEEEGREVVRRICAVHIGISADVMPFLLSIPPSYLPSLPLSVPVGWQLSMLGVRSQSPAYAAQPSVFPPTPWGGEGERG